MDRSRLCLLGFVLIILAASPAGAQSLEVPVRGNFGTLTIAAPDGQPRPCGLRSLQVRVVVEGEFARTEVEQVFVNPFDRQEEGTFEFELPPNAAVNRLALEIDGKLVEGEVVERHKARMVYEKIVRSMRDPALMEWQGGNRFKTQVYPIPARGEKRVVLAFLTRLARRGEQLEYRYQLPAVKEGGPEFGRFRFDARLDNKGPLTITPYDAQIRPGEARYDRTAFRPRGDFVVRFKPQTKGDGPRLLLAKAGQRKLFGFDWTPRWVTTRKAPPMDRDVILLVDTSASMRGPAWTQAGQAIDQIIAGLTPKDRIQIISGDLQTRSLGGPVPAARAKALKRRLDSVAPAGGTDLLALLSAGAVRPARGRRTVAIYLGDGQASLGELDGDLLADQVRKAYRKAGAELSAVGIGPSPSGDYLRRLTRENGGRYDQKEPGRALDLGPFLASLNQLQLVEPKLSFAKGCALQVLPARIENLAWGERLQIMGQWKGAKVCKATLKATLAGKPFSQTVALDIAKAGRSDLLPVFWARARIAHLERVAGDRREIVALSKEFGIMSRYTSWLVLENEEAYKKHQIERRQKAQQAAEQAAQKTPKGPLTKKKLGKGESMADFLKGFQGDEGSDADSDAKDKEAAPGSPVVAKPPAVEPPKPAPMEMREAEKMEAPAKTMAMDMEMAEAKPMAKMSKKKGKYRPPSVQEQLKNAREQYKTNPHDPWTRRNLVAMLMADKKQAEARKRVQEWFAASKADPEALLQKVAPALEGMPDDAWTRAKRIELYRIAWEAKPSRTDLLVALVGAMARADKSKEAFDLVERERKLAKKDSERLLGLIPAYGALSSHPGARKALLELSAALVSERPMDANIRRVHLDQLKAAGLKREALAAVIDWRRFAPDFPELVIEHARMLKEAKQLERAERVLSELVEFNPHAFDARSRYAASLEQQGRPLDACAQYTRAVQLNPSERNTFRTMMAMRRTHPKSAKALNKCIVDGVSRLPVIRDVSIVMLWEDDSADIDMHIVEAGGETVWYQHQESAQGGQLYYDVTDGFGPEIYVLGAGKPGTYHLKVVYYSGSKPVKGKFIVMRNAGGPEETRKEYPFRLQRENSDKKVPVARFKISR